MAWAKMNEFLVNGIRKKITKIRSFLTELSFKYECVVDVFVTRCRLQLLSFRVTSPPPPEQWSRQDLVFFWGGGHKTPPI